MEANNPKRYHMARIKSKKYNDVHLNRLSNGDITYTVTYKDAFDKKYGFSKL